MSLRLPPLTAGDTRTLELISIDPAARIPLIIPNTASLIFTAKRSISDLDSAAVFQKATGVGITATGSSVDIDIVPNDTSFLLADVDLYCDLQAQDDSFGVLTIWSGVLPVKAGVTRGLSSSVAIYTTNPPVPSGGGGISLDIVNAAYAATVTPTVTANNLLLNIGALTGNLTLANPAGSPTDGQIITVRFVQDSTGGRVITYGNAYAFGVDITQAMIPTAATITWELGFKYHAGSGKWRCVAIARGF